MVSGVTFVTVKAGVELFHKAGRRIRAHEKDQVSVAKNTLKQSASDLVRAQDVNDANLQAVANEYSGLSETDKGDREIRQTTK